MTNSMVAHKAIDLADSRRPVTAGDAEQALPDDMVRIGLAPDAPDMTPAEIEHYRNPEAVAALEEAMAQIRSGQGHHGTLDDLRQAWEEHNRT